MKTKSKWRHPDDQQEHDRLSRANAISFRDKVSMTSQAERDNCDLNILVRRFGAGPLMRPVDPAAFGVYHADLDLQSALQTVADAQDAFDALPAGVRKKFDNDPLELLAALRDPANREELEELGILRAAPKDLTPPASIEANADRGKGGKGEGPSVPSPKPDES